MFLISSRALYREWLRWAATNPATNYDKILEQQRAITKHVGAAIVVLDMPLLDTREGRDGLTNVLISDIVLQLLSYVVQVERESIRQRQAEGFAAAKAHGARVRRPKKRSTAYTMTKGVLSQRTPHEDEATARLKGSVTPFVRWLKEDVIM